MRHQRAGRKLGRDHAHRKALYANLTGSLIEDGRIRTTVAKAKEVRPIVEQMITLGRRGDIHARRQALAFLRTQEVVHRLFAEVAPRCADRPGGYTRIVKLGPRQGDAAEMAYLELVDFVPGEEYAPAGEAPAAEAAPRRRGPRGAGAPAGAGPPPRRSSRSAGARGSSSRGSSPASPTACTTSYRPRR